MITVLKNEPTASLRRMYFHCVDVTDGMTPETGEAGGQPQILVDGAWTNTGIGVLVAIGNGRYYAELTQAITNIADRSVIEGRYKSASTAEAVGTTVQIIAYPVDASVSTLASHLIIRQKAINDASPTTLKFITTLVETTNDYWNNAAILFTAGANTGVIRSIKDYVGGTKEITLNTALPVAPSNGDAFSVIMTRAFKLAGLDVQEIRDSMKLAPTAGDPVAGSVDKHIDDIIVAIAAIDVGAGTGDTAVNHNTGGANNLQYVDGVGVGIDNAIILGFLKTDYDAGNRTGSYIKGRSATNVNGQWATDMMLDAGNTYTIQFYKQGLYGPDTKEVTI